MKESIGYTYLLNIIIIFIVITFFVLMGTLSYTKAFKINSRIISEIEKFEGYNRYSIEAINNDLSTLGYQSGKVNSCPDKDIEGARVVEQLSSDIYAYCIYEYQDQNDPANYYYGVLTYMYLDFPVIGKLVRFPIYAQTDRMYDFSK